MYTYKPERCRIPIKIWSKKGSMEAGALKQIENAASLPFAFHHNALMPDGHCGYGAPIGGVMAAKGVILPNFVGVDIGCGMLYVGTNLTNISIEYLKKIMDLIRKKIPVGKKSSKTRCLLRELPKTKDYEDKFGVKLKIVTEQFNKAKYQIGTLGGGNHFIEIQKDEKGTIGFMIHSGSRNLGHTVATYYNNLAIERNEKWISLVPKNYQLAFLPTKYESGRQYLAEMTYCVDFALMNRNKMMENIKTAICSVVSSKTKFGNPINIAHNYAAIENHFDKNVVVHRKGATLARKGTIGIIPGSQGTSSYIVEGLGNPASFMSCSHGAGRLMSRTKAKDELSIQDEIKRLDDMGVIHAIRGQGDLDEAPGAYKDIEVVMKNQEDLVEIINKLQPLAVVKG